MKPKGLPATSVMPLVVFKENLRVPEESGEARSNTRVSEDPAARAMSLNCLLYSRGESTEATANPFGSVNAEGVRIVAEDSGGSRVN